MSFSFWQNAKFAIFGKTPKTKREAGTTEIKYTDDPEVVGAKYRSGRTDRKSGTFSRGYRIYTWC